jgi:hypothetical protein
MQLQDRLQRTALVLEGNRTTLEGVQKGWTQASKFQVTIDHWT